MDDLLFRIGSIFVYLVLLWGLSAARRDLPGNPCIEVARKIVFAIVGGVAAVATLGLVYRIMLALLQHRVLDSVDASEVGPLILLIAGGLVLWPIISWRVASVDRPAIRGEGGRRVPWMTLTLIGCCLLWVAYLLLIRVWLRISPFAHPQIAACAAGAALCVYLLVPALVGRTGRPGGAHIIACIGVLAVILGGTITWPVLLFSALGKLYPIYTNPIGKWTYFTIAAISVAGIWLMAVRFVSTRIENRLAQWGYSLLIGVIIFVSTIPALLAQSQVTNPHAYGLMPWDLFDSGPYPALPQLLNWLLLILIIAVVTSISDAGSDAWATRRVVLRRLAIPAMMLLLYGYSTWLWIPLSFTIGLLVISRMVLPRPLASEEPHPYPPPEAIKLALDAWRNAELAANQRQKLLTTDADDMRKLLIKSGTADYVQAFDALADGQNELAERHDTWECEARSLKTDALDHKGQMPSVAVARRGAITGLVVGIIPATLTLLTRPPPLSHSGYPVLDFIGGSAWIVLLWPALGWVIGYFLPFIHGDNGIEKALWVLAAAIIATLPLNILLNDEHGWIQYLSYTLELFSFLLILCVVVCDLAVIASAGMRYTAWVRIHNWRFVVSWSTALLAAIGTAAVTFLATTATDIGHQTVASITGSSAKPPTSAGGG